MKTYEGKFWLFHGVRSGLGLVDYNEKRLITRVFEYDTFLEACKAFYQSAMETTQRYLPQINGKTVSVLSEFIEEEKNLINLVSEALKEITTQNSDIRTYKSQGNHETGIIIRISLHEKLLIDKYGVEKYAFMENLRAKIHPPNELISGKKQDVANCSPYDLNIVKRRHQKRTNKRPDPKTVSPYDLRSLHRF